MKKTSPQDEYLKLLKERGAESRVYKPFQLAGLLIAEVLGDEAHKALYIKLAKEYDARALFQLAKDVAERKGVKNRGAYFMKVFQEEFKAKSAKRKTTT